jgi:VIT1/CCC1 family predicted Fe2+/Mn2+ transporter
MAACLYFLKLNSAAGIILSIVLGVVIFGITLWIIKAFDEQDKQMIKQLCMGITPAFIKKHF